MKAYLDIIRTILTEGVRKSSRTGIDAISAFGLHFRHDLCEGFPLLTTKKMDGSLWNSVVHELLWFISGEKHIRNLRKHTKIWNAWADENGDLQSAYGWYWRHFPSTGPLMRDFDDNTVSFHSQNIDQLGLCVNELKTNPMSRRLVVSAWDPGNAWHSKLPPCHAFYVFNVQDGKLCLSLTMRSTDFLLGAPFNIASYALLMHIIAKEVNLQPGILDMSFVDAHIYAADENDNTIINGHPRKEYDHVRVLQEQMQRNPLPLPSLTIKDQPWDRHEFDDFELINYKSHGPLKAKVAV